MNTRPTTTHALPGVSRRFGLKPLAFAVGGVLAVAGVAAYALSARDSGDSPAETPAVAAVPPAESRTFSAGVDTRSHTFYLVDSDEQATSLKSGLAESDALRYALGEPALLESVVVVGSSDEAARFTAAVAEGNRTLVGLGLGEDRVVDLRDSR